MRPSMPSANMVVEHRHRARVEALHRAKLRTMLPVVQTRGRGSSPQRPLQGVREQIRRSTEINRENTHLVQKMCDILQRKPASEIFSPQAKLHSLTCITARARTRHHGAIVAANEKLLRRLLDNKPAYSRQQWHNEAVADQAVLQQISRFPPAPLHIAPSPALLLASAQTDENVTAILQQHPVSLHGATIPPPPSPPPRATSPLRTMYTAAGVAVLRSRRTHTSQASSRRPHTSQSNNNNNNNNNAQQQPQSNKQQQQQQQQTNMSHTQPISSSSSSPSPSDPSSSPSAPPPAASTSSVPTKLFDAPLLISRLPVQVRIWEYSAPHATIEIHVFDSHFSYSLALPLSHLQHTFHDTPSLLLPAHRTALVSTLLQLLLFAPVAHPQPNASNVELCIDLQRRVAPLPPPSRAAASRSRRAPRPQPPIVRDSSKAAAADEREFVIHRQNQKNPQTMDTQQPSSNAPNSSQPVNPDERQIEIILTDRDLSQPHNQQDHESDAL